MQPGLEPTTSRLLYRGSSPFTLYLLYWQNFGANKIFASTKYWHRQNICVDKIQATKCWRMRRSISLLFWPCKVRSSLLLQNLADVLLLLPEDVVLSMFSHQVCCCHWPPCFYGWTLSCTVPAYLYQPAMQKTSQILASTKYRHPPRFH